MQHTSLFYKKALCVLVLSITLSACSNTLKPFASDGCSSFPDGTFQQNQLWLGCCIEHDLAYWAGGTYNDRLEADERLQMCVADVGEPEIALLMLAGVRVGGTPILPTSYRWGYGWPYPKPYAPLTEEELKQINAIKPEPNDLLPKTK